MARETPLRILIVEDDPVAAQALQALLRVRSPDAKAPPVSTTTAATLAETRATLGVEPFDAILLDLNLPDSAGSGTVESVLQAAGSAAVVVLTGVADEDLALRALRLGAQDYIIKGEIGRNALHRAIRHAVERKAALRAATAPGPPPDRQLRRQLDLVHAENAIVERLVAGSAGLGAEPKLEPGATIAGRYRLAEVLGAGTTALTFRAEDEVLQRVRVLKALLARRDGEESARRFLKEARLAAAIEHPRVVGIRDFGLAGPVPYIVMDLVHGTPLSRILASRGALPPGEAARTIADVLEGLTEIHRSGILHRDLKPSNIMIGEGGATIIDFGLATALKEPTLTSLAPLPPGEGTLGYMSPEALEGAPLTPASDVYSVGAVLYEMLAGRSYLADAGTRRAEIEHAILARPPAPLPGDTGLAKVALRALEKDPAARYASADEMRAEILALDLSR